MVFYEDMERAEQEKDNRECENSLAFKEGYKQALDDFVKLAEEHEFTYRKIDITNCVIDFIKFFAEQLKAGGKNDSSTVDM